MLDVNQLAERGCLQPGCSSTCQWTDGNEVVSINFRAEAGRVHLSYPVRVGDREWRDVTDSIDIITPLSNSVPESPALALPIAMATTNAIPFETDREDSQVISDI